MVSLRRQARPFGVTALDAGLLIAASAAVVIMLGGRTRINVAGARISLRGATNFLLFAAGFGALRLWLGRGLRPLPALPCPDRPALDAERERFAAPPRATRDVWRYGAATVDPLDANPSLERLANERREGADVRLYRVK